VTDISWIIPLCFVVGLVCALIWIFIIGPPAKLRIERFHEGRLAAAAAADAQLKDVELSKGGPPETALAVDDDDEEYFVDEYTDTNDKPKAAAAAKTVEVVKPHVLAPHEHAVQTPLNEAPVAAGGARGLMDKFIQNTVGQDLHAQSMHESPGAARIWEQGATYDDRAEHLFNYVQVFTACLNSFAHGANDVSNTIAPLSAIIHIYQKGTIKSKTGVDKWVLAFGGAAIVIGLLL
jgi:solute carrier family 20 (sodium-dependent phosphate transporter)